LIHFLDTSALVKRYVAEAGSPEVRRVFRAGSPIAVARISYAELAAAVSRRRRDGELPEEVYDSILGRLDDDFAKVVVVEIRAAIVERVPELVRRHPLRGYDAVQLAAALSLRARGAVDLWAADGVLIRAATAEGFRVTKV
jgi:predicted nucleic acid-binding protein